MNTLPYFKRLTVLIPKKHLQTHAQLSLVNSYASKPPTNITLKSVEEKAPMTFFEDQFGTWKKWWNTGSHYGSTAGPRNARKSSDTHIAFVDFEKASDKAD